MEVVKSNIFLPEKGSLYQPFLGRIIEIKSLLEDTKLFKIKFEDEKLNSSFTYNPGQFVELSVIGTGEIPVSISSSPTLSGVIELCVRKVGRTTEALHRLKENSLIGIRGPYGNGFPVKEMKGSNLLLVAGGLGMAPLRSLLKYALDCRKDFKDVILMYGARNPEQILFKDEINKLSSRKDLKILLTVDKAESEAWKGNVGVVTSFFDSIDLDEKETFAVICGPHIMFKFVIQKLLERNFPKEKILISLERRMKCGVGKCGHCNIGEYRYVCIDGPVFNCWDVLDIPEMI